MSDDAALGEVEAMRKVAEALKDLDEEARRRVLRWANDRFGFAHANRAPDGRSGEVPGALPASFADSGAASSPADLGELYAAVAPETDADRALLIGYWIQTVRGEADFDAQAVNKELKHLGHGVANITLAFTKLIEQRPQLVIQTRKQGTTQQARKKYKVTAAGIRSIQERLGQTR